MSDGIFLAEYSGHVLLQANKPVKDIKDSEEVNRTWEEIKACITAELEARGLTVTPWYFRKHHHTHGGVTTLYVSYDVTKHKQHVIKQRAEVKP